MTLKQEENARIQRQIVEERNKDLAKVVKMEQR